MLSRRRFINTALSAAALSALPFCSSGGSSKPSVELKPFAQSKLGLHIVTYEVFQNPDDTLDKNYPTQETFERASAFGNWAVAEFFMDRWLAPDVRIALIDQARSAKLAGLNYIIRLEDSRTYAIAGTNPIRADESWFYNEWLPYALSVVDFTSDFAYGYQIGNEVWNVDWTMRGPGGGELTVLEYLNWFKATRAEILKIAPSVNVLMSGVTTVTEDRYWSKLLALIDAGILDYSDLNIHLYPKSNLAGSELNRLRRFAELARSAKRALFITEINTHDPGKSDAYKLSVLQNTYNQLDSLFDLRAFCVFLANNSLGLSGWTVLGTELEGMIKAKTVKN